MEHKIGDKVRIKQLTVAKEFSGLLGEIVYRSSCPGEFVIRTEQGDIQLHESKFINLNHPKLKETSPEVEIPKEITDFFEDTTKQISVTFNIPVNLTEGVFSGQEQGIKYSLYVEKVN